jgi:tetratricopeptide (TPR) repeat protein
MKVIFLFILGISIAAGYAYLYNNTSQKLSDETQNRLLAYKKQFSIGCSVNRDGIDLQDSANTIPLLDGWGKYYMPVTTSNDSSGIYFEQGINMYYGFHIIEALASFEKSTRFDSNFAMGYWGKALAYGPNINDFGYSASPGAISAIQNAKNLSTACTDVEKALINAMLVRYSLDSTDTREHLNQLYANAMKEVYQSFPKSADAAALYVDALMVQHPWDLYGKDYQPKPWTPEIVNALEKLLRKYPNHPGASHYYIHAIEASAHPQKGIAIARKLPGLMPGVSHVVHMPSHIYIRSGYYSQGENVNKQAVKSYYDYAGKFALVTNNAALYLVHNLHMQATCSNMSGKYKEALTASIDCRNSFDSSWQGLPDFTGIYMQYIYMTPYLTLIRFGKWNEILNTARVPSTHVYASLLWHYGRGLAYARKHDFVNARKEMSAMETYIKNDQMKAPAPSYSNSGIVGGSLALSILQGVIAEEQHSYPEAVRFLRNAVVQEDSMQYNEPKDWVHPARQYLGNVLLKAGRYAEAEKEYTEDLKINPKNGWSLTGLATALSKQGKSKVKLLVQQQRSKAFADSDVQIITSVF